MSDIDDFEAWAAEALEVSSDHLKSCRHTYPVNQDGYLGLAIHGYSNEVDILFSMGIVAFQAARSEAYVLRKQADAIEEAITRHYPISYANELRQQANKLEQKQ